MEQKRNTYWLTESEMKEFRKAAIDEGLTAQDVLRRLVLEYLESRKS